MILFGNGGCSRFELCIGGCCHNGVLGAGLGQFGMIAVELQLLLYFFSNPRLSRQAS